MDKRTNQISFAPEESLGNGDSYGELFFTTNGVFHLSGKLEFGAKTPVPVPTRKSKTDVSIPVFSIVSQTRQCRTLLLAQLFKDTQKSTEWILKNSVMQRLVLLCMFHWMLGLTGVSLEQQQRILHLRSVHTDQAKKWKIKERMQMET